MSYTVTLLSFSLLDLKKFLNKQCRKEEDPNMFKITLNGVSFSLPIELAFCFSKTIQNLLDEDYTIRSIELNIKFINPENTQKIIHFLKDLDIECFEIVLTNLDDICDFAQFGSKFGCKEFLSPMEQYLETQESKLNSSKNAEEYFQLVVDYMHTHLSEMIFEVISKYFYLFIEMPEFISWSCQEGNENSLEEIISDYYFKIKNEEQFLDFLITVCKENQNLVFFV